MSISFPYLLESQASTSPNGKSDKEVAASCIDPIQDLTSKEFKKFKLNLEKSKEEINNWSPRITASANIGVTRLSQNAELIVPPYCIDL